MKIYFLLCFLFFKTFCFATESISSIQKVNHMNSEQIQKNLDLIDKYFNEVWNKGNIELLEKIIAKNYINHSPGAPNPDPGPEGLKPIVLAIRKAFPDLKYTILRTVVSEDQVAVHVLMEGTHKGDFFGIAPSNKKIKVNQMQIEKIINNQIVEHWRVTDDLNLLKQIGVIH